MLGQEYFLAQCRYVLLEDTPYGRYQSGDDRPNQTVPAVLGE